MRPGAGSIIASITIVSVVSAPVLGQQVRRNFREAHAEAALVSPARVAALVEALQADRFSVRTSGMFRPPVVDLACAGLLSSCNGNNASNPYMVASVPPVGYEWREDPPLGFMLRQDEAIVLVGRTPPPVSYFSYRSFIFSRFIENEGVHRTLFVSLGDPNNMLTIKTTGTSRGDPYDRAYVLVAAADKAIQERILSALHLTGYPDAIINLDVISPNLASPGLDLVKNDEFVLVHRLALWKPGFEEAGQEYIAHPPVTVLRVTPEVPVDPAAYRPLPVERLRPRGTGRTEMDYTPEVEELRRSILAAYPGWKADEITPAVWLEESFDALQRDVDVLGESRDTVYLRTQGTFNLDDDDFLVIYGANHEATGKATYANFAIYDPCKACGIAGENSRHMAGSALDYVGANNPKVPHVDALYAWKVARDCGSDPRCTTVPPGTCPSQSNAGAQFFIGFRAYVEPATKIGPAFTEVIFDRVIRFSRGAPVISEAEVTPELVTTDGTPATISFHVSSSDNEDVTWTATLLPDHGCATLEPATGVIAGGNGDVQLTVTPPPGQRTTMNVRLDAADASGHRATPRTVQPVFYWQR
jgi:hypothetical protein